MIAAIQEAEVTIATGDTVWIRVGQDIRVQPAGRQMRTARVTRLGGSGADARIQALVCYRSQGRWAAAPQWYDPDDVIGIGWDESPP